jgi:Leucine-rich repeat (LRR) protein
MNPIGIKKAIDALIQDQENNADPSRGTIAAIFALTKENFSHLNGSEQKAVIKLYKDISKTKISEDPELGKPFLEFKKALFAQEASKSFMGKVVSKEFGSVREFLSLKDLGKMASSSKESQKFSDEEKVRRLNRGTAPFSLGLDKKALLLLLKEHGHVVTKLSLNSRENVDLSDIKKIIELCPNLTSLAVINCNLGLDKEALFLLFKEHGHVVTKLSLNSKKNVDLSDIKKIIGLCPNLTSLAVIKCNLGLDGVTQIAEALVNTKISELDLSENNIGEFPIKICDLVNLTKLDLYDNKITDIPEAIQNLSNLQKLYLSNNKINPSSQVIGKLVKLTHLDLSLNQLNKIPQFVEGLSALEYLDCESNNIKEIPLFIENLTNLKELHLGMNEIAKVSPSIEELIYLKTLSLNHNRLKEIPEAVCRLRNLRVLKLCYNQISSIRAEIGQLVSLERLLIHCNKLPHALQVSRELKSLLPECDYIECWDDAYVESLGFNN